MKCLVKIRKTVLCAVSTGLHILVIKGNFPKKHQCQQDCVLCDSGGTVVYYIGDFDAAAFAVGQVYAVISCSQQADELYIWRVCQCALVHRCFVGNDDIGVFDPLCGLCCGRVCIAGYGAKLLKAGHVNVCTCAVPF